MRPRNKFPIASNFAPRSLPVRLTIAVELHPDELYKLIRTLEAEAIAAADHPEQVGYADYLFQRIAALREAGR